MFRIQSFFLGGLATCVVRRLPGSRTHTAGSSQECSLHFFLGSPARPSPLPRSGNEPLTGPRIASTWLLPRPSRSGMCWPKIPA
jgi:hypothetical protein